MDSVCFIPLDNLKSQKNRVNQQINDIKVFPADIVIQNAY